MPAPKCVNCDRRRWCMLIEIAIPAGDTYETTGSVSICRECIGVVNKSGHPQQFITPATLIAALLSTVNE